jgi:hypothetical protein
VLGKRKNSANVVTGMQEGVHWELKDVLQVEEEARRVRAGAGKLGSARGGSGSGGATWRSRSGPARAGERRRGC